MHTFMYEDEPSLVGIANYMVTSIYALYIYNSNTPLIRVPINQSVPSPCPISYPPITVSHSNPHSCPSLLPYHSFGNKRGVESRHRR